MADAVSIQTYKALSGETRLRLLSALSDGERNLTDLARAVGKDKSTVLEHAELLMAAGLLSRKKEAGRKWVFYGLTDKGTELIGVQGRNKAFLWTFLASISSGGFFILRYLLASSAGAQSLLQAAEDGGAKAMAVAAPTLSGIANDAATVSGQPPLYFYAGIFLIAISIVSIYLYLAGRRRVDFELAERDNKGVNRNEHV